MSPNEESFVCRGSSRSGRAFSLIEMLVVLAFVGALLALSIPSLVSLNSSMNLTQTGDNLVDFFANARQQAIAANSAVEIRFYDLFSEEDDRVVKTLQVVHQSSDGTYIGGEVLWFPAGVGISRDSKLSSFFSSEDQLRKSLLTGVSGEVLPADQEAGYLGFRFNPDGSTTLPSGSWFLTVVLENREEVREEGQSPANFYTIQMDPVMGRIRTFRP